MAFVGVLAGIASMLSGLATQPRQTQQTTDKRRQYYEQALANLKNIMSQPDIQPEGSSLETSVSSPETTKTYEVPENNETSENGGVNWMQMASMLGGLATQQGQVQQTNALDKRRQYYQQLLGGLYPTMSDLNIKQNDIVNTMSLLGKYY